MKKEENKITVTSDEAKRILQEEVQQRVHNCRAEIKKILEENSCILIPEVSIVGDQIRSSFRIVPRG